MTGSTVSECVFTLPVNAKDHYAAHSKPSDQAEPRNHCDVEPDHFYTHETGTT